MTALSHHLKRMFLAGVFAAVPVVVTAFVVWYIHDATSFIPRQLFGWDVPLFGVVVALVAIYLLGLLVTSLLGKYLLNKLDRLLQRVPIFKDLYAAWKQISLTPGGGEGTFRRVVIVPDENPHLHLLGFCSGQPIPDDPDTYCVFIPNAPNPLQGRLCFVKRQDVRFLDCTAEEAFKMLLSTGNYIPPGLGKNVSPGVQTG